MRIVALLLGITLACAAFLLSGCAGTKSEQIPTITGNNNTVTINQSAKVDKASETEVDAAGSGYGSVAR